MKSPQLLGELKRGIAAQAFDPSFGQRESSPGVPRDTESSPANPPWYSNIGSTEFSATEASRKSSSKTQPPAQSRYRSGAISARASAPDPLSHGNLLASPVLHATIQP